MIAVNNQSYHCCQLFTDLYPTLFLQCNCVCREHNWKLLVWISMCGSRRITYCVLVRLWRENCKTEGSADCKKS